MNSVVEFANRIRIFNIIRNYDVKYRKTLFNVFNKIYHTNIDNNLPYLKSVLYIAFRVPGLSIKIIKDIKAINYICSKLEERGIVYQLTGSYFLLLLGIDIYRIPHDIDINVLSITTDINDFVESLPESIVTEINQDLDADYDSESNRVSCKVIDSHIDFFICNNNMIPLNIVSNLNLCMKKNIEFYNYALDNLHAYDCMINDIITPDTYELIDKRIMNVQLMNIYRVLYSNEELLTINNCLILYEWLYKYLVSNYKLSIKDVSILNKHYSRINKFMSNIYKVVSNIRINS